MCGRAGDGARAVPPGPGRAGEVSRGSNGIRLAHEQRRREVEVRGMRDPPLRFGTWLTGADAAEGVRDGLEIGYRQIDTAARTTTSATWAAGSPKECRTARSGCCARRSRTRPLSATRSSLTRSWIITL